MEMTGDHIKKMALSAGADLCGVAPAERFCGAPEGFRPADVFPDARSVVVIAKRFPEGALSSRNFVLYTAAGEIVRGEVGRILCEVSIRLQDRGVTAVPVPGEPYMHWDADSMEGRGILSLRHAGLLAGLGVMGRNTMLINEKFGNRISLGALILNIDLEGDPIASYRICSDDCNACIKGCPAGALDGKTVSQKLCRQHSQAATPRGYQLYICNTCRTICPYGKGAAGRKKVRKHDFPA